jgi:hypothetical protein
MVVPSLLRARSTAVWAVLVVATLVSWAVGSEHRTGSPIAVIVLGVAMVKVRFVGLDFMELRHARSPWGRCSSSIASPCGASWQACIRGFDDGNCDGRSRQAGLGTVAHRAASRRDQIVGRFSAWLTSLLNTAMLSPAVTTSLTTTLTTVTRRTTSTTVLRAS